MPVKDGDVIGVVKSIWNALGMDVQENMIDECHLLGKKLDSNGHPNIIVKFVRRTDAETLLAKRSSNQLVVWGQAHKHK